MNSKASQKMHFSCFACSHQVAQRRPRCPACRLADPWVPIEPEPIEIAGTTPPTAAELLSSSLVLRYLPAGELSPWFPQGLTPGFGVVFVGGAGSGKSRTALRWGSTTLGPCLFLSLEMSSLTAAMSAQSCGADLSRLHISHERQISAIRAACQQIDARSIVLDSVQKSPDLLSPLAELAQDLGLILIAISRVNSHGGTHGGTSTDHELDATLFFSPGKPGFVKVRARKNRLAPPHVAELPLSK